MPITSLQKEILTLLFEGRSFGQLLRQLDLDEATGREELARAFEALRLETLDGATPSLAETADPGVSGAA